MNNCTGEFCPMQHGKVDPPTCACASSCTYVTPPIKTVYEQECPELMKAIMSADPENFVQMTFRMFCLCDLYDERGRAGLREAEERFKENKIDLYELLKKGEQKQ